MISSRIRYAVLGGMALAAAGSIATGMAIASAQPASSSARVAALATTTSASTSSSSTSTSASSSSTSASSSSASTCNSGFSDVPSTSVFCADISYLVSKKIAAGYSDGTFRPTAPVSRQAAAAFLYRYEHPASTSSSSSAAPSSASTSTGASTTGASTTGASTTGASSTSATAAPSTSTPPACTSAPFTDVPVTSQFCPAIAALKSEGVISGYSNGTFKPFAAVSRQAMASFLYKVANPGKTAPACTSAPFSDVPTSNVFCGDIAALSAKKVITGYSDGTFRPTVTISRQSAAAFIHRLATS